MEAQRVLCGGKAPLWASLVLLLLHLATSHGSTLGAATCPRTCVPIRRCPQLSNLLNNPTPQNINTLRAATCRVVNREPMVCCPPILLPRDCGRPFNSDRIHGGEEVTLGTAPWMAILGYRDPNSSRLKFLCGGSVINERYVLTATHCLHPSAIGINRLEVVRLGEWDLTTEVDCTEVMSGSNFIRYCAPPAQDYGVEQTVLHPLYNTRTDYSDDIALIRLTRNIDLSQRWIHPVCIPPPNFDVRRIPGTPEPVVAGWGFTENGTTSQRMLSVSLPFVTDQECNVTYRGQLNDDQMCLGGRPGQDSCTGDSGGPLVVTGPRGPPYLQIGVVSYGPTHCGQANFPGIYTAVSHYRTWIEENMRPW